MVRPSKSTMMGFTSGPVTWEICGPWVAESVVNTTHKEGLRRFESMQIEDQIARIYSLLIGQNWKLATAGATLAMPHIHGEVRIV